MGNFLVRSDDIYHMLTMSVARVKCQRYSILVCWSLTGIRHNWKGPENWSFHEKVTHSWCFIPRLCSHKSGSLKGSESSYWNPRGSWLLTCSWHCWISRTDWAVGFQAGRAQWRNGRTHGVIWCRHAQAIWELSVCFVFWGGTQGITRYRLGHLLKNSIVNKTGLKIWQWLELK